LNGVFSTNMLDAVIKKLTVVKKLKLGSTSGVRFPHEMKYLWMTFHNSKQTQNNLKTCFKYVCGVCEL
jgi:hypothetical protein